jgi:ankyrin repeat protein
MFFPKASYSILLILALFLWPSIYVSSQEVVTDTNDYYAILRGSDVQGNLDYALFQAASQGNTIGIDWLIRHEADVNATTVQGITPVIFAVSSGEKEALKILLKYKPDLDVISVFNESALMVAVKDHNFDITELLLRDSANVNLKDRRGFTALHYAVLSGYLNMTDLLLYYDADVNIRSNDGTTPLMVAAHLGFADITDLLLQNRARVSDLDNEGFTPLMFAAQNSDTIIMDLLIKRGADLNAVNKYNYDALDLAIRLNLPDAVKFLLKSGANDRSSKVKSVDPYSVASIYRRNEITGILRENNIPETEKRGFDQVSLSGSAKLSFHNIYTGFSVTIRELKNNIGIIAGFDLEPGWSRVLVKSSGDLYYQYMDKSYLVYTGILKELSLTDNVIKGNWYFCGSIAAGYSFGNEFKGTNIKPDSRLRFIPSAGFRYNKNAFNFEIGLEYTNTEYYKIGPVWLRTGISFNIDFRNLRGQAKIIKW